MPYRIGDWESPGARERTMRFARLRNQTLESLEPAAEAQAQQALDWTSRVMGPQAPAPAAPTPTLAPPPAPQAPLAPSPPIDTRDLLGITPAPPPSPPSGLAGLAEAFAPPTAPVAEAQRRAFAGEPEPLEAAKLGAGGARAQEFFRDIPDEELPGLTALSRELTQRGMTAEQFQPLLQAARAGDEEALRQVMPILAVVSPETAEELRAAALYRAAPSLMQKIAEEPSGLAGIKAAPQQLLGAVERVREFEAPVSERIAGALALGVEQTGAGVPIGLRQVTGGPQPGPATAAVEELGLGAGLREAGAQQPIIGELTRLTNWVPIPVLDPLVARALGVTARVGARVTPQVFRNLIARAGRLIFTETTPPAVRRGAQQFLTESEQSLEQLGRELGRAAPPAEPVTRAAPEGAIPAEELPEAALRQVPEAAPEGQVFYHATSPERAERMLQEGFPAGREGFVTTDPDLAFRFGQRFADEPVVLEVRVAPGTELGGREAIRTAAPENLQVTRALSPDEVAQARQAVAEAPPAPAAVDPATELPTVAGGAGPPARSVSGQVLPERGSVGAQQVLDLKEETLRRPGVLTQMPGVKQVASGLNPAVGMDRQVLVSYNARQAVDASLNTEFAALRHSVMRRLQGAWDAAPPRYTGPKNNAIKNTIKDWANNPDFYAGVSSELRAAAKAYDDVSNQILARTRGEFGVDIRAFSSPKEGSFYMPTVRARETLDDALLKVSDGYTSAGVSVKTSRAKTRVYEGAYQRWQRNPDFLAETDLAELTGLHDRALATMAGNETFRLGAGGRSRLDIMQELHPDLYRRMLGLRQRLGNLRGTAGRLNTRLRDRVDDFLVDPQANLSDVADALDVTVTRGRFKDLDIKAINAEIKAVRLEIRNLRPGWEAANLEPYVLNRKTFRYHTAEQSVAVDKILQIKLPMGDGLVGAIDEVRLFAFAGDVSPLTIQGLLGILSDPITGARSLPRAMRTLFSPEELLRIGSREPELVQRFTRATGRPFGELGAEFVQTARGIERIPVVGPELNRRLMSAVELIRYNQWKTDQAILRRLNPGMSQAVADAEAANALSKVIPALNPAERGASILQSRLERLPVISTSFIGAPVTITKDAASGLAKLTLSRSLSPAARWQGLAGREQLAILHLGSMAGSLATASIGTHILSGWSPEDAVKTTLDPNSPRFLSIALGKSRRIPVGGPLRSAARAFVPRKVGEVEGVPVYVPFMGTAQWLKGKITPAISAPIDLARNADYFGGKIATGSFPENVLRMAWFAVNSVLPLAVAEPSEAIRTGEAEPTDIGRLAELGGAQFAGIDLRETSLFERFRWAFREEFDIDYDGRERHRTIAMANPRLREMLEGANRQALQRGYTGAVERWEREQSIAGLAEGLSPFVEGVRADNPDAGRAFLRAYSDFKTQRSGVFQRDFFGENFPDPDSEEGQALNRLGEMNPHAAPYLDADPETGTFQVDWDRYLADRDVELDIVDRKFPGFKEDYLTRPFLPEEFRDVEEKAIAANQLVGEYHDMPRFRNVPKDLEEDVLDFLAAVGDLRGQLRERAGVEISVNEAIQRLGTQRGLDERFITVAELLRPGSATRAQLRNIDRDVFLLRHVEELRLFYPELYESNRIRDALFRLSGAGAR